MITPNAELFINRQCWLSGITRSIYYRPRPPSAAEIDLPNRLDRMFTEHPVYGSRRRFPPPKHGSWLNRVEGFFSKMVRSALRSIRVASEDELKTRIVAYLDDLNRQPVVHTWTCQIDTVT